MASMMAAAVSAALAVYVALQAARGMRAAIPTPTVGESAMIRNERRDGRLMCACAVPFCLFLAALAVYAALAPGAAEVLHEPSGLQLAATTTGGLVLGAVCIWHSWRLGKVDADTDLYRMREVPVTYAALCWSAICLEYVVALA